MSREIKPLARQIIAQLPADKAEAMQVLEYIRKALMAEPEETARVPVPLKIVEKDR